MKKKEILKTIITIIVSVVLSSGISVYATSTYLYDSCDVSYDNTSSGLNATNVQSSLDELYMHATDYTEIRAMIYPVGSIYLSVTDDTVAKVEDRFGGTWEKFGEGRTLISANSTYPINTTGGSASHQHKYGLQYGAFWAAISLEGDSNSGLLNYRDGTNYTIINSSEKILEVATNANKTIDSGNKSLTIGHYKIIANTSATSSLPPYISVYMYKRIS